MSLKAELCDTRADGIWHTGIEVYGNEFFYGGGIQSLPHQQVVRACGQALLANALETLSLAAPGESLSPAPC